MERLNLGKVVGKPDVAAAVFLVDELLKFGAIIHSLYQLCQSFRVQGLIAQILGGVVQNLFRELKILLPKLAW